MEHRDTAELVQLDWSDAQFDGFEWVNDGKDLRLFLEHASRSIVGLVCHWASDLRVDLKWSRPSDSTPEKPILRGGPLLTLDVTINEKDNKRWHLFFDFADEGQFECECQSITTVKSEETS